MKFNINNIIPTGFDTAVDIQRIKDTPDGGLYPTFYMINKEEYKHTEIQANEETYIKLIGLGYFPVKWEQFAMFCVIAEQYHEKKHQRALKRKHDRFTKPRKPKLKTQKVAKPLVPKPK